MNHEIIYKYFQHLSDHQKVMIEQLFPLYSEWNAKINVISRKDIESLYLHHVLHSLAIAKFIEFKPNTSVLDIGTGGGFPGIPLAIFFPETEFTLCDSILKKIKVVTEVSTALGLKNVKPLWDRAENINNKYNYIVSRAVTDLSSFLPLVKNKYSEGIICLKGGDTEAEIRTCRNYKNLEFEAHNISNWFEEDFFSEKKIIFISR